jgi:hypothetical protein
VWIHTAIADLELIEPITCAAKLEYASRPDLVIRLEGAGQLTTHRLPENDVQALVGAWHQLSPKAHPSP